MIISSLIMRRPSTRVKGRGEGDFSSKKVAVVNSLIRFQRKSGARAFSAVWMGFGDRQRAEPEPAIFIFRRSNTTLPPPLSSLIVCVPCIYTRVYTPVSFILIPLHLETRHGAAQQPRVGNAPFCPATTTTRPKPPSPQPTRHCNFVQSYFDVSLTLSPLANLKSPSILPGLPPYSLARNSTFSRLAATIVFEKPSMLFLRSFATRAILFLFSLFFLRIVAILIRPLLFSTK